MSIAQCESHFTAANIQLVSAFPHAMSPSSAPSFLPGCWQDLSLWRRWESSTTLLFQKLFDILFLPLSRKSSVFPHHSESAPSSPSPFLLLCESPGWKQNPQLQARFKNTQLWCSCDFWKSATFPWIQRRQERGGNSEPRDLLKTTGNFSFCNSPRCCVWNRNYLKLTQDHARAQSWRLLFG